MSDKTREQVEKDFWKWWDLAQEAETSPIEIWQAAHEMYSPSGENVHICTTCSAGVVGMVVNGNLEPYEYDDTTQLGG